MPRRGNNRVGVEVDVSPTQKSEDEPHADSSSAKTITDGAPIPHEARSSESTQALEAAMARRQKELLRKKKHERRAHAKQRAAEKQRRLEEKKQKREMKQMLEEDVPVAWMITASDTSTEHSKTCIGGAGASNGYIPTDFREGLVNETLLVTAPNQDDDSYPVGIEMVPKHVKSSSKPSKSANAAAHTIQKALKKKFLKNTYKKCKSMFRQSSRVFAEEMIVPTLPTPMDPAENLPVGDDGDATKSTNVRSEGMPTDTKTDELCAPPGFAGDSPPQSDQAAAHHPIVPPLLLQKIADNKLQHDVESESISASCSSSCDLSDCGSHSVDSSCSCSCSCSCSSSGSSLSSESATDTTRRRRRRSKDTKTSRKTSKTARSTQSYRCSTHTARASHSQHTSRSSPFDQCGPPCFLLEDLPWRQSSTGRKEYGEVHHFMATRIQARVRGCLGRSIARQLQAQFDQELKDEAFVELQHEACLKIQSRARGVLVRKKMPISDTERRRRRRRRAQLRGSVDEANSPRSNTSVEGDQEEVYDDPDEKCEWPAEIDLEVIDDWQDLNQEATVFGDSVTQSRFLSHGKLRVFCGTWNMHAKKPTDDLRLWIRPNKYHIVAVGSEECVNSIAKSVVFTSKKSWEDQLRSTLGADYVLVSSHALTAIHNVVFVHTSILPLLGNIQSDAVATGLGNQLGNKGGVGIAFSVGSTSFAFVNCHFEAHQRNVSRRNGNFHRINHELRLSPTGTPAALTLFSPAKSSALSPIPGQINGLGRTSANRISMPAVAIGGGGSKRTVSERFDRVFWFGDLNYRINGTRRMVDMLLMKNQHEVLCANDQLQREMKAGNVFNHFREGQLLFRPTYKFDKRSDVYDSSPKQRIPSWTDRVLYLSNDKMHDVELLSYRSQANFRTSDHRPVCAVFQVNFNAANAGEPMRSARRSVSAEENRESDNHVVSQACTIQ